MKIHSLLYSISVPVNCEIGEWGNWTPCSDSCGGGEQIRKRGIATAAAHGGSDCSEDMMEARSCRTQKCPSTVFFATYGTFRLFYTKKVDHLSETKEYCISFRKV